MNTLVKETSTGFSLWIEDRSDKILIDAGMSKYEMEKFRLKFDNMIARHRDKIIDEVENIALKHYDPDDWDFREKVKTYREQTD